MFKLWPFLIFCSPPPTPNPVRPTHGTLETPRKWPPFPFFTWKDGSKMECRSHNAFLTPLWPSYKICSSQTQPWTLLSVFIWPLDFLGSGSHCAISGRHVRRSFAKNDILGKIVMNLWIWEAEGWSSGWRSRSLCAKIPPADYSQGVKSHNSTKGNRSTTEHCACLPSIRGSWKQ